MTNVSDKIAATTGIIGALLLALNLGYSGYAYIFWIVSSVSWLYYGLDQNNKSIIAMNWVFYTVNLIGLWCWFKY